MSKRGEAIYHRKDGLWEARYVKEIDAFGKKKYGSVYGHSYREAKEKRQDALDHILLYQTNKPTRKITISHLANEWLYINKNKVKISTFQRYEGFIKNHINSIIGQMGAIYLSTAAIHEFSLKLLDKGLSNQSVNSVLIFLHSCMKYGHRQYNLPLPEFIYLSCTKKEMRVLSEDEQKTLVCYLLTDMDIYKLGVLTALYTGLRIGELCALRWEDIDKDAIKVRRTMQRLRNKEGTGTELYIGPPKTETSARIIPIPSFLKEKIDLFRKENDKQTYFLSVKDMPITEPRVMQYKFKKYLKDSGIDKANFHALRHSFATRCVEVGFDIKSLSNILGHSSSVVTVDRYVHSSFSLKKQNMELLSKVVNL